MKINIVYHQTQELCTRLLQDNRLAQYLNYLKNHHQETYLHTLRVCSLSLDLGFENGMDSATLIGLGYASLLHDIGKALIPRDILVKTTGLNTLEQEIMREHVRLGFRILDEFKPEIVKEIVVSHHEFGKIPYPRNGYDRRNASREFDQRRKPDPALSCAVQILAIADMFDALVQPRAYKDAFTKEQTEAVLRQEFSGDAGLISQILCRLTEI